MQFCTLQGLLTVNHVSIKYVKDKDTRLPTQNFVCLLIHFPLQLCIMRLEIYGKHEYSAQLFAQRNALKNLLPPCADAPDELTAFEKGEGFSHLKLSAFLPLLFIEASLNLRCCPSAPFKEGRPEPLFLKIEH